MKISNNELTLSDLNLIDFDFEWVENLINKYNYKKHATKNYNTKANLDFLNFLDMDINNF